MLDNFLAAIETCETQEELDYVFQAHKGSGKIRVFRDDGKILNRPGTWLFVFENFKDGEMRPKKEFDCLFCLCETQEIVRLSGEEGCRVVENALKRMEIE